VTALRVLITNRTLTVRGGTQLYTHDLAVGLLARRHRPVVYSPELGEVARALHLASVPVVDDLSSLGDPPDVIHGQSGPETLTALLAFPTAPAIFVCHGWWSWYAAPPRLPRIARYVAVDEACLDRLVFRHGIPGERARVLLNAVDLDRFRPRPPLPDRPRRALVFSNTVSDLTNLNVFRRACRQAGLRLDVVGFAADRPSAAPERLLGAHDVVFAKGRSALEALAVGNAVVVSDAIGMGPMVTAAELDRLRRANFGTRAFVERVTVEALLRELQRYDPRDAQAVSRRIREEADTHHWVDELIALYRQAIDEKPGDPLAEGPAAAAYLQWMSRRLREESDAALLLPAVHLANRVLALPGLGPVARWAIRKLAGRPRIGRS
jgi:glycosyltransferase involved in cell wall biosynthesis